MKECTELYTVLMEAVNDSYISMENVVQRLRPFSTPESRRVWLSHLKTKGVALKAKDIRQLLLLFPNVDAKVWVTYSN